MDDPHRPSSSFSSSSSKDVFISFRGPDTRKCFVCHLHKALERQLVSAYLDTENLRQGDDVSNLFKAIAEAKISIVVLSENYATSKWCLKELVKIMECKEQQKQLVIPIFYDGIEPSHVGYQLGSFAKAFAKHKRARRVDNNELESWKRALLEASKISGSCSDEFGDDTKLIDAVVKRVSKELIHKSSGSEESGLVGIEHHIKRMKLAPPLETDKFRKVGIWGTGGIGKTAIATTAYNRIHSLFQYSCVVENVKDKFQEGGVSLLKDILSRLGIDQVHQINTKEEAYHIMKELQSRTVLVVLDDIDKTKQIDTLLVGPPFGKGSIIIVTTRNSGLLTRFDEIYEVELLSDDNALILFSKNAFKTNKPLEEYVHVSNNVVKYAQGLPLALEVLGGLLGPLESAYEWEMELKKIVSTPNMEIQNVLERSYYGLDDLQKAIFLDIACFFRGWNVDSAIKVLDECGFYASTGIRNLVQRALVTISKSGELEMHDLIQEMGRQIECKAEEDGTRKRFWSEDGTRALNENTVSECVEGLMIDWPNLEYRSFNAEAFERMRKLRLLIFTYKEGIYKDRGEIHLIGDLKFLSSKLRVLIWHRYPLKCLPSNFDPKNLLELDMKSSHIEQLCEGFKYGHKLISIDLSGSPNLMVSPDITGMPSLKRLDLGGCFSLTEVHPSIFSHNSLVFMSLVRCNRLKSLPSSMHMKSLETLDLSWCTSLEMIPDILGDMEALSKLRLNATAIKELPSSIDRLKGLQSLYMSFCGSLVCLPESICNLAQLRYLDLTLCSKLKKLPENIGSLESLSELDVRGSGLEQLPVSILHLKLRQLSFRECLQMAAPLSSWPSSIEDRCTALVQLDFSDCNLMELSDAIVHFSSLKALNLSGNNNLESLPATMNELGCLELLILEGCRRLKSIPELSSSISHIDASNCTALETVSAPQSFDDISRRYFIFTNCSQLVKEDFFRDIAETHFPPQGNPFRPFNVTLPGSEIPKQFIHRCRGSSVTVRLPPNWFDNQFLGFAICAVTNKSRFVKLSMFRARCLCTFTGDQCKYRFSFSLFDRNSLFELESNQILVGYMPWSEFGINGGEAVNERSYTEATFEIQFLKGDGYSSKLSRFEVSIERCGVRFFFGNNVDDFEEPMVQVGNSERSLEVERSTSDITCDTFDEDEEYLRVLSQVFKDANRARRRYIINEDNEDASSENRIPLETWTQQVRFTWDVIMQRSLDDVLNGFALDMGIESIPWTQQVRFKWGPMQASPDDGFNLTTLNLGFESLKTDLFSSPFNIGLSHNHASGISKGMKSLIVKYETAVSKSRPVYLCHGCRVKAQLLFPSDRTIRTITYTGRHTCWRTQPMLTYQVRITPDMEIEGRDDGFRWRKYGEMDTRVYYVCNPQNVGGCMAVKEVQRSKDQKFLRITYRLRHTCTLPSTSAGGTSEASGASSVHDQAVESPSKSGGSGHGEIVIGAAESPVGDNNAIVLQDASSKAIDVNDMEDRKGASCLLWCWSLWTSITSR